MNLDPTRAGIFAAFKKLGADIEVVSRRERGNDVWGDLNVKTAKNLIARKLNPDLLSICLDEIPLLAALACFTESEGIAEKEKETILKLPPWAIDFYRPLLEAIYKNLKIAGVECGIYEEGLIIRGKTDIVGEGFDCQNFPVLGLALSVLNRKAKSKEPVKGIECVEKVYPPLPNR